MRLRHGSEAVLLIGLAVLAGGCSSHAHFKSSLADGADPSSLILGSDGYLYGTTAAGGTFGAGTVFRLSLDGDEAVLHVFRGDATDGGAPNGLVEARDGFFYGTTGGGGIMNCPAIFAPASAGQAAPASATTSNSGCGVVFRVDSVGGYDVVYFFKGSGDGAVPNAGIFEGSDDALYGTTQRGGGAIEGCTLTGCMVGAGVAFRVTATGAESVLHSFGTTAGGLSPDTLLQGSDGDFYGTTDYGGSDDYGVIFRLTPTGAETVLHAFDGLDGSVCVGLVELAPGELFGATYFGGVAGNLFEVSTSGVFKVLYDFQRGGTSGSYPGFLLGADGLLYGTTSAGGGTGCGGLGCGVVFVATLSGSVSVLYTFAQVVSGKEVSSPTPGALVRGTDGNLYGITESDGAYGAGTVYRLTPAGVKTILHSFGGTLIE